MSVATFFCWLKDVESCTSVGPLSNFEVAILRLIPRENVPVMSRDDQVYRSRTWLLLSRYLFFYTFGTM